MSNVKTPTKSGLIRIDKEVLTAAGIERGDRIEVFEAEDPSTGAPLLILQKASTQCFLCNEPLIHTKFKKIKGKPFCKECLQTIQKG